MNVIGILSSPRGGNSQTRRLAQAFAAGVREAGGDVELVDLCALNIAYCQACDVCHRTGHCVHEDDFPPLRQKLVQADAVMFSSPNYFRSVTAQLKTMIDRMADFIHLQLFAGKYACCLTTSGGPEWAAVTRYLEDVLGSLGAQVVGSVGVAVSKGPEALQAGEHQARALGRSLVAAVLEKRADPVQAERHRQTAAYFRRLVELNRDRWPYEYQVWAGAPRP